MPVRIAQNKFIPHGTCALLWDESFIWGLMAWRALSEAGLPFALIRSEDIRAGMLSRCAMIFVPGGWATAKTSVLGKKGQAEIQRFVENGGSYLGICGGAGLATDSHLGLLPVQRRASEERVPSFSGPIRLTISDHPIWKDVQTPVFHAWWPPQLHAAEKNDSHILARYDDAQNEAMSADIRMEEGRKKGWSALEKQYGIFLDPERLKGEPAVVEGACGRGKVILSLVHFDTPGDLNGALVLRNLWRYLIKDIHLEPHSGSESSGNFVCGNDDRAYKTLLDDIKKAVDHLIVEGERNLLWHRRNDLLLQWRRGLRGIEYSTLAAMTEEIVARLSGNRATKTFSDEFTPSLDPAKLARDLEVIKKMLIPFVNEAAELLRLEQAWLTSTSATLEICPDEKIQNLRQDLFGSARSFGGRFKPLIDAINDLLFHVLKQLEIVNED